MLGQKSPHFAGTGFFQAQPEPPEAHIDIECMTLDFFGMPGKPHPVSGKKGVMSGKQRLILG